MPIEVFTEWKCSKCKKVHREAGDCENSLPAGWAEGTIKVYGKDGQIKQLVYPALCPACTIATLKEWGVPRKRQRKAKAEVPVDPQWVVVDSWGGEMEVAVPVPAKETETDTAGLSATGNEALAEEPPKPKRGRPRKADARSRSQVTTIVIGEVGLPSAAPRQPKPVTIACPHGDPTPHTHVQEGDLTVCRYPEKKPKDLPLPS